MNYWEVELEKAIKRTKMRIKLMEKHGRGAAAMQEKFYLKKQERTKELRK